MLLARTLTLSIDLRGKLPWKSVSLTFSFAIVLLSATAPNRGMYSGVRLHGSAVVMRRLHAATFRMLVAWPTGLILRMLLKSAMLSFGESSGVCRWNRPDACPVSWMGDFGGSLVHRLCRWLMWVLQLSCYGVML